jgi:hypothetical protein
MIIIVKSRTTGNYSGPESTQENEIFDVWYFDTLSPQAELFYTTSVGGSEFEMQLDQFIVAIRGSNLNWFYTGPDVYPPTAYSATFTPLDDTTFTLTLSKNIDGGDISIINPEPPFLGFTQIEISATVNTGFNFLNWSIGQNVISPLPEFIFTMPFSDVTLTANYLQDVVVNPEDPEEPEEPQDPDQQINISSPEFYPLEIRVNGIKIPLKQITAKIFSNLLTDAFEGEYTYPIDVDTSLKMLAALNFPNDPQSIWSFDKPFPAQLWRYGNRENNGMLEILEANDRSIRSVFALTSGFFIEENKTLKISDCYSQSDMVSLSGLNRFASGGHELRFNLRDIKLTVNSTVKIFLKADFETHIDLFNAVADYIISGPWAQEISYIYSEDLTDEQSRIVSWDTSIITAMTLAPVTGTSRFTRARRLTNERLELAALNNIDPENRIAFPSIYNRALYDGNNPNFNGVVNRYDQFGRVYFDNPSFLAYSEAVNWPNTAIPFIYLIDVIKKVFQKLKIEFSGTLFQDPRIQNLLLYNNKTLDYMEVSENGVPSRRTSVNIHQGDDDPIQEIFRYKNVLQNEIILGEHLPDVSVTEFLKALKNYFFLSIQFNSTKRKVELSFIRDVIRNFATIDMTRYASRVFNITHGKENGIAIKYDSPDPIMTDGKNPIPDPDFKVNNYMAMLSLDAEINQTAYVRSLAASFVLTADQDAPPFWKLLSFDLQDEKNEDKQPWTMTMYPLVESFIDGKKMPAIEMTGNNEEAKVSNKTKAMRIFAFYGQRQDSQGNKYGFASTNDYDALEIPSEYMENLHPRSSKSNPYLRDLEAIVNLNKKYGVTLTLDEVHLQKLATSRKIKIGLIEYVVDQLEITHSESEISIAAAVLYKIKK